MSGQDRVQAATGRSGPESPAPDRTPRPLPNSRELGQAVSSPSVRAGSVCTAGGARAGLRPGQALSLIGLSGGQHGGGLSRGNHLHREGQLSCREEEGRGLWNLLSAGGLQEDGGESDISVTPESRAPRHPSSRRPLWWESQGQAQVRWRNSGPGPPNPLGWRSGKQGSGGCTQGHREEVCDSPPCSRDQDKRVLGLVRQAEVSRGGRTLGLTCLSVPSYAESSLIALAVCTLPFPRCALGSQSAVATEAGQSEGQGDRCWAGGTFRAGLGVGVGGAARPQR